MMIITEILVTTTNKYKNDAIQSNQIDDMHFIEYAS